MLLSINPEHVENILSGKKRYEFRKRRCKADIDMILIYSTSPVMKVVGEVEVTNVIVDHPNKLWDTTANFAGISKDFFDKYFENKEHAVAYELGRVNKYDKPLNLEDFDINAAPQSFIYV